MRGTNGIPLGWPLIPCLAVAVVTLSSAAATLKALPTPGGAVTLALLTMSSATRR
jgi:hypothetical protein